MRVLIAEDDPDIASGLCASLRRQGHVVDHVDNGAHADAALGSTQYALLVLDLGLPQLDGRDVLQRLRQRGDGLAVLVVTARDGLAERVRVLDLGADDYLVKPFALDEFEARVRAQLRRVTSNGNPDLRIGRLRLDLAGHRVWIDDQSLELTAREFGLLSALAVRAERIVSRAQLVEALCDWGQDLTDNGLDIALHRLRRKLQPGGMGIRTVRGGPPSLRRRLLAFLALPMLGLLIFNTILAYYVALDYSNRIHDRNLIDDTHSFAQMLSTMPVTSDLSPQARFLIEYDPDGHRYFNVDSSRKGTLSGNADFSPYAPSQDCAGVHPALYDGNLNGQQVRMATVYTQAMNDPQDQLAVTVAESMADRRQRAREILMIIIPLMTMLALGTAALVCAAANWRRSPMPTCRKRSSR
ncbi:hypothetical protein G6F57_012131 [Rhizopus arrhizus]|nr:hypothetical protein G6F57_012131 [Rhizopus arrhizus]